MQRSNQVCSTEAFWKDTALLVLVLALVPILVLVLVAAPTRIPKKVRLIFSRSRSSIQGFGILVAYHITFFYFPTSSAQPDLVVASLPRSSSLGINIR